MYLLLFIFSNVWKLFYEKTELMSNERFIKTS